jgi:putative glutamine amidotransferase
MKLMRPRIAIATPHSAADYCARALPQYTSAVEQAGGAPIVIPLDREPDEIAQLLSHCDAALLPGSPADVDPQKYDAARDPHTAAADSRRDMVDELLLQDAYNLRKPILGICYGLQSLNVWRTGTLVQHIESPVKHTAGREVLHAHSIAIEPVSKLATILGSNGQASELASTADLKALSVEVNSSHHQAADVVGDGLRVVARCPDDRVIEALEGTSPEHFVLAVQWHPERMTQADESARAIFQAFVAAAAHRKK